MRLIIAILVMVPITLAMRTPLPRRWRDWRLILGTGVILLGFNTGVRTPVRALRAAG
jgi:hypothetical protein